MVGASESKAEAADAATVMAMANDADFSMI